MHLQMVVAAAVGTGLPGGWLPLQLQLALQGQHWRAWQQQAGRAQLLAGFLQLPASPEGVSRGLQCLSELGPEGEGAPRPCHCAV